MLGTGILIEAMVVIPFPQRDENLALVQPMIYYKWHRHFQTFTPADSRSQPAPTTRALPSQDATPDDLG